jgi:Ran GTPase-activating protein 1
LAISKALPSWPNLKNINLGDCLLSAQGGIFTLILGVHVIKAMTNSNEKLERIGLFFNEINQKGAALVPLMLANKINLLSIELNGNTFDAESDLVKNIRSALIRLGKPDALVFFGLFQDELDEMEEPEEEEEEEEVESGDETPADRSNLDDLAAQMGGVHIKGN